MQEDLIKMKQTSATVIASQKSMEAKYAQASKTANEWYSRAQLALEKGWPCILTKHDTRRTASAS